MSNFVGRQQVQQQMKTVTCQEMFYALPTPMMLACTQQATSEYTTFTLHSSLALLLTTMKKTNCLWQSSFNTLSLH